MKVVKIALTGNPNSGKTTVFNALTGARQRVGNWPGVTVERVVGEYDHDGNRVEVTDLPGIYSFSALSPDEEVARRHVLFDRPDVVVNVVDASNLERNLYLATQLLEMKVPMVLALNMMDRANRQGLRIDAAHLAKHLGCPVVPIVAAKKEGMEALREAIAHVAATRRPPPTIVRYDANVEALIEILQGRLTDVAERNELPARWLAVKLLEGDEIAGELIGKTSDLRNSLESERKKLERLAGEDVDLILADGRYGFIHGLALDVTTSTGIFRRDLTDAVDRIVLNKALGFPVFFFIMYLVFAVTINFASPFIDFFDRLSGTLFVDGFGQVLRNLHAPDWTVALLAEGLGGGIQTVSTFIPPIFLIFLCLSFLEDSGYMARAAFVMDNALSFIGLPGKAFIPMLVGFGCNVPGILATRTLENRRDRILAILINPFMSCGARLPVYTLFAAAFFPRRGGWIVLSLYLTGIVLAVLSGLLFKRTLLRGDAETFVMELPPYHLPTLGGVLYHTWHRLKSFILKAGQVILLIVVVLGFFNAIGTDGSFGNAGRESSVLSAAGRAATPLFRPMGIREENWPAVVGLFTGIFAKETVIGTLDTLYAQFDAKASGPVLETEFDLRAGLRDAFAAIPEGLAGLFGRTVGTPETRSVSSAMIERFGSRAAAYAYLLFILIYAPCVAALAAIAREIGARWMFFSVAYLTALAWIVATVFYQLATFSVHPAVSAGWLAFCALLAGSGILAMRTAGRRSARHA